MSIIEIVGTSKIWYDYEEKMGLCHTCSGEGKLAVTERACYYPELYSNELIDCPDCKGTGKRSDFNEVR